MKDSPLNKKQGDYTQFSPKNENGFDIAFYICYHSS